jgi:hypothetical protein
MQTADTRIGIAPMSVLVLANFIRDVLRELFESMRVDEPVNGRRCVASRSRRPSRRWSL